MGLINDHKFLLIYEHSRDILVDACFFAHARERFSVPFLCRILAVADPDNMM